jgi:Na+/glutamate symporter
MMASQVTLSSLSMSLIYGIIGSIIIVFLIKRLMKKYKYNDRERLKENAQDKVIYAVENKAITYLPQIIMFFLVLLANYLLISM